LKQEANESADLFVKGTAEFALRTGKLTVIEKIDARDDMARLVRHVVAHFSATNFDQALADSELAVQSWPDQTAVHILRAVVLNATGHLNEALETAGRAAELAPEQANVHSTQGDIYSQMGRHAEARDAYRRALELEPTSLEYHQALIQELAELDQIEEALAANRQLVQRAPDNADYQTYLGWLAYKFESYEESIVASQRAMDLAPLEPVPAFNLALACLVNGQSTKAIAGYAQALLRCLGLEKERAGAFIEGALTDLDELAKLRPELLPDIERSRDLLTKPASDTIDLATENDGAVL